MRRRRLAPLLAATATLALAAPAQASTYRVRWGDTLTWIAQDHHVSLGRLAAANHIDPYGVLVEGTVLRIPSTHLHRHAVRARHHHTSARSTRHVSARGTRVITVQWGDTLSGIAAQYGTTLERLARLNGLHPYGILLAGASLRVPAHAQAGATGAPPPSTAGFSAQRSIDHWSAHYGVDRHLARAVAWMESGYQTGVVSSVGAWGVMQIMPDTWRYTELLIGHAVPRTPDGNVRIGVAYLHHLLNVFGGNERLAVAAYYQGPGAVRRFGLLPASQIYVADVMSLRQRL
jgi:LysM repeat protein